MYLKLWGVRGSIPVAMNGEEYQRKLQLVLRDAERSFQENRKVTAEQILQELPVTCADITGGNTGCFEIGEEGSSLIVDLGSGARQLGYHLASNPTPLELHILMTATDWANIQGWPFFLPSYWPESSFHFHSSTEKIRAIFEDQQNFCYFPVPFHASPSKKEFHAFSTGNEFMINNWKIKTAPVGNLPGQTAYRLEKEGRSIVIAFNMESSLFQTDRQTKKQTRSGTKKQTSRKRREQSEEGEQLYRALFSNCDLLLLGIKQERFAPLNHYISHYVDQLRATLQLAFDCGPRQIVFCHHHPFYSDEKLLRLVEQIFRAKQAAQPSFFKTSIEIAREEQVYLL